MKNVRALHLKQSISDSYKLVVDAGNKHLYPTIPAHIRYLDWFVEDEMPPLPATLKGLCTYVLVLPDDLPEGLVELACPMVKVVKKLPSGLEVLICPRAVELCELPYFLELLSAENADLSSHLLTPHLIRVVIGNTRFNQLIPTNVDMLSLPKATLVDCVMSEELEHLSCDSLQEIAFDLPVCLSSASFNAAKTLPVSIQRLHNLYTLYCNSLESLPDYLPNHIAYLHACSLVQAPDKWPSNLQYLEIGRAFQDLSSVLTGEFKVKLVN